MTKTVIKVFTLVVMIGSFGYANTAYAQAPMELTEEEAATIEGKRKWKEKMKQKMHKKMGFSMEEMKKKMQEQMGFSEEQQKQLEKHRESFMVKHTEFFSSMMDLKEQSMAELKKENFDEGKVREIFGQITVLQNKMAEDRLEGMLYLRSILTVEQFQKFMEFIKSHHGGPGGFMKGSQGGFGFPPK